MEITPHLSETELAEFISAPSKGLGTHLQFCDVCLTEVARLRETVAALKGTADKPEEFWGRQRAAIRTQIASAPVQSAYGFHRLAWAPVFAVVILAGVLLSGGTPATKPVSPQAVVDPDHELLMAVEQVMRSNGPAALEPAAYFVQEIKQEARPNSNRNQEIRNEN